MKAIHQVVQLVFASGYEGERNELTLHEQDQRALSHGELFVVRLNFERLDEISAQQLLRLHLQHVGFAVGLEAFAGREIRERAEVVFGFLETGIGRRALGGDYGGRIDGVSGGLGRALENGEQKVGFTGLGSLLHLLATVNPAIGNLKAKSEIGVAVKLGVVTWSRCRFWNW